MILKGKKAANFFSEMYVDWNKGAIVIPWGLNGAAFSLNKMCLTKLKPYSLKIN